MVAEVAAEPMPSTARPKISISSDSAVPAIRAPAAKIARPAVNTRSCPKISPIAALGSRAATTAR